MRRKLFLLISGLVISSSFLGLCQAAMVVDTGPGPSSGDIWFLDSHHNGMAGKFTTSQVWNITSVETWIQVDSAGQVIAAIYSDNAGGDIPGTKMYSQSLTLSQSQAPSWQGAKRLNWVLPAGTWWVGFEVVVTGFSGLFYIPAVHPLVSYAYNILGVPYWQSVSGLDVAFRIQSVQNFPGIDLLLLN